MCLLDLSKAPVKHAALVPHLDKILAAKRADAAADVSAWEREIDERVYRLYGLTPEEIKIVEGGPQNELPPPSVQPRRGGIFVELPPPRFSPVGAPSL